MLTLTKSKILFRNKPLCSFTQEKPFMGLILKDWFVSRVVGMVGEEGIILS